LNGPAEPPLVDRELSWLHFNGRVLQEATDPSVPLFERLGFLGIFSSNLDEFFRVRVASIRTLLRLKKKRVRKLPLDPVELLRAIHHEVNVQQEAFGVLFRDAILPELEARGIHLITEHELDPDEACALEDWFRAEVAPGVIPIPLRTDGPPPFLEDRTVYLVVEHSPVESTPLAPVSPQLSLVPVPSPPLDRFVVRRAAGTHRVLFLDDVVRLCLGELFPGQHIGGAWAIKLSRDAELYLEDEFEGDVVEAMRRSLAKRDTGTPARFLYDPHTPAGVLDTLREALALEDEDLVVGGRYHNLHDLRSFPRCGATDGAYEPWSPVPHPVLDGADSVQDAVARGDQLLHFPYHSYDHAVRFLTEAAADPNVEEIWLTVYRVSRESAVLRALLSAAERGKAVHVFVEVKARFDEAANLEWAERLERAGIVTLYSAPELKVHAKLALVVRREHGERVRQAYLGTGNFNEDTARLYTDFALLTADPDLTREVETLFRFLSGEEPTPSFEHLLVAPFDLRQRITGLIEAEAERARRGEPAGVTFKLNALEDETIIGSLYEAARAGVSVRGIVRGICRMVPGVVGWSEGVHLRSIVDRYLEHGRAYVFENGGNPLVYLASADWMYRNLDRRVEVVFPVRDPDVRGQILETLDLQFADNRKARILDGEGLNRHTPSEGPALRSQETIRQWLAGLSPR
jgi:polyphosphate kinase